MSQVVNEVNDNQFVLGPLVTNTSSPAILRTVVGSSVGVIRGAVDITSRPLFPIEIFLQDVQKIAKGRLKDWKEEEHIASKLLFRLAKRKK